MKTLLLISLMYLSGCKVGQISFDNSGNSNVIGSRNVTIDYDQIIQEGDNAKLIWKGRAPTKEDRQREREGEDHARKFIKDVKQKRSRTQVVPTPLIFFVSNDPVIFWDGNEFNEFLDNNPKVKTARKELQYLYFYTSKIIAPSRILIYECHRSKERQLKLKKKGLSQVRFGQHNYNPSRACDFIPLKDGKARWEDYSQIHFVIGVQRAVFDFLNFEGLRLRSGADWDENNYTQDKTTLYDPGHSAIRPSKKKI